MIPYDSDLHRQQWVKDNLLAERHNQFWLPYTGKTSSSVIYNKVDLTCGTGHTIIFSFRGKLTGKMAKGRSAGDQNAEQKRIFSTTIVIEEWSVSVDNERAFEACSIDDLEITQHSDSIAGLRDLFYRHKDQATFDSLQGIFVKPTHIYDAGNTITYNKILSISSSARTGRNLRVSLANGQVGTTLAKPRIPLDSADSVNGITHFLIVDEATALKLKQDPTIQNILMEADVRGKNNALFTGALCKVGGLLIVEAPVFYGESPAGVFGIGETEIQYAGLRRYAVKNDLVYWEGQPNFETLLAQKDAGDATVKIYSRNLLVGSSALQTAWGKLPDYSLGWKDRHHEESDSKLKFWANWKKTNLKIEAGKDYKAKATDIDFGVIAVDVEL